MDLQLQPLTLDLARLDGLTQRLVASHHENNYAGAVAQSSCARWARIAFSRFTAPE